MAKYEKNNIKANAASEMRNTGTWVILHGDPGVILP